MEDDLISQLPDNILISIITRISTKEAVKTSILSKRWRNIYKFVSDINVSCHCHCPTSYLWSACDSKVTIDGLHRILQIHSGFIRSFECRCFLCRCCLTESYAHIFEECIYSLGKGIEKLLLQFSWLHIDFLFPCHLLSHMPSLKYFELSYCSLRPNLNSHCKSLKTLRLSNIKACPGSLECILSNCLSLCSLLIKDCKLPSKLCFRGSNLQLKCILICDCKGVEEIELYASNLVTFEFKGLQMVNLIFDYVPQLQCVYLSLWNNTMPYCGRLGKDLPSLKSLLLDIHEDGSIPMGINMFSNLKRLDLNIYFLSYQIDLLSLTPLLHSCPLLEEFHLATKLFIYYGPQVEKPVVVHSQLKKVDISGFVGTKNQCDFVLYILKSCVRLQQMYISWNCNIYSGFGEWKEQKKPSCRDKWSELVYEDIKQLKDQAVSKTVQVIFQKSPRIKSKQSTKDGILVD